MGQEDLSLDEIIRKRKIGNKRVNKPGFTQSNMAFQRKTYPNRNPKQMVVDARTLINSKSQMVDAREKIKAKTIVDARQKLEQKKLQSETIKTKPLSGRIPKVTILNTSSSPVKMSRQRDVPRITFHVTQGTRGRGPDARKKVPQNHSVSSRLGSGIKIAVRNELAQPKPTPRQRPAPAQSPLLREQGQKTLERKKFERLKITTINKEAMKPKPTPAPSSPPKPIRKRTLPIQRINTEDSPPQAKQSRQQRSPEEDNARMRMMRPDGSTLRPMISRIGGSSPTAKMEEEMEVVEPTGPSPIEGTKLKVSNLHPVVTEDDILELFSVLGAVRRARLVKPGEAEVVYIKHEDAFAAYKKYNNRDLDGQPMQIKLLTNESQKQAPVYSWMKEVRSSRNKTEPSEVTELHSGVLQQALFKGGSTGTSTRPVVFTVKI